MHKSILHFHTEGPTGAVMCFVQSDRQHPKQCVIVSTSNQPEEVMYCTLTWNNAVCFT